MKKLLLLLTLPILAFAGITNANTYKTSEEFLKAEGQTCKTATDGCNSVSIQNGKLGAMTEMYCEDIYGKNGSEKWTCKDSKTSDNKITSKEAFLERYGNTCEVASDGCNTVILGKDGKGGAMTMMYCEDIYGPNGSEDWTCKVENKISTTNKITSSEDFLKLHGNTCQVASDGCNTVQIIDGKLGGMTKMYCENIYGDAGEEDWTCKQTKVGVSSVGKILIPRIERIISKDNLQTKITKLENVVNKAGALKANYIGKENYIYVLDEVIRELTQYKTELLQKNSATESEIIVKGEISCVGVAPQTCLDTNIGNLYSGISGFTYEKGFTFKLRVLEVEKENVPADASSVDYLMVEIISKTANN